MRDSKITFNQKDSFLATIRSRVEAYFVEKNRSPHATWSMVLKGSIIITGALVIYFSLIFGWFSSIPRIFFWLLLGVSEALLAVNIGHDALHGSYSKYPKINRLLGFLGYDFLGLSSYVWKQTHNKDHHTYTNISGADPDINKPVVLRLSPHDPYYSFHAFQHIYVWILYALLTLDWVLLSDYDYVIRHRKKIPLNELAWLIFFKLINLGYMIVIPLLVSPMTWWEVAIGYIAAQLIAGVVVSLVFQLAHLVEGLEFPLPNQDGVLETSWASHEMATTANFATHSTFISQITGGLNFQIEHHLFPKICHVHYQNISPIIRKTAEEYHLPYHENPSLSAAIASHIRLLRQLGKR